MTAVGPDNHFVAVSGSAAAAAAAFGTQVAQYVVNGKVEPAPSARRLGARTRSRASSQAVSGLTTLGHRMEPSDFGPPTRSSTGCRARTATASRSAWTLPKFQGKKLPWAICGYTPAQLRGAYGVDTTAGAEPARPLRSPMPTTRRRSLSDANTYSLRHGDQPFAAGQFSDRSVPEDAATGEDCGGNGWYGEQTLDVEAVHGMAPVGERPLLRRRELLRRRPARRSWARSWPTTRPRSSPTRGASRRSS